MLHLICVVFVVLSHFNLISCHDFVFAVFARFEVFEPGPALRCGPALVGYIYNTFCLLFVLPLLVQEFTFVNFV